MHKIVLSGALAISCLCGGDAYAMGGSGNLSPSASPYAIIAPQTLTYGAPAPTPATTSQPARAKPRRRLF